MPDKKPRIVPKLPLPKHSLCKENFVVTLNPHPRLKVIMKGTSNHIVPVLTYPKKSIPNPSKASPHCCHLFDAKKNLNSTPTAMAGRA